MLSKISNLRAAASLKGQCVKGFYIYRQVSNIRRTKSHHLKDSLTVLVAVFGESLEARCQVNMKM